ncbi:signal peptide peptidase SppA [Cellulosilyticum sp. I15G10I2]|uniref:signal peptide peptidase SppA n=1 Tax=Cellulosilyticum sp. I15G10I2 TaxID=1892843 RepID=UPI0009F56A21|nr:signal peptide peptidase SppA [Cellulosilyticum sp. I15G10I2]
MGTEKKKNNVALIIGIIILSIMFFVIVWGMILSRFIGRVGSAGLNKIPGNGRASIEVIYVEGTIGESGSIFSEPTYKHRWTIEQIDELMYSPTNQAILLYVNSPGGGVYESDELYLKLKEYKEVTQRPIYAYMAQTAASGGYYICMAADKVYANRMTMTGSIGVIMSTIDTSELEQKIGIKTENVVSGKNKAMGNPLTEEQRQILQSMVDETYNMFVEIVAENRKMDFDKTKQLADGRVYTASQAKELNLIDAIGNFDTVISDLKTDYGLEDADVYDVINERSFFDELFSVMGKNTKLLNEFNIIKEYIEHSQKSKLMYY